MNGWSSLNPNAGRVTLGKKIATLSPIPKAPVKRFVVQSTDMKNGWRIETPDLEEGLAEDLMVELRKTNKQRMFRLVEVK